MTTVKFATQPFTCPSCIAKIETTVARLDGVEDVKVMFNSSKVKVTFDESAVDAGTIERTITGLGYPVLSRSGSSAAARA